MLVRCDSVNYFSAGPNGKVSASVALTPIGDNAPEQFSLTYPDVMVPIEFFPKTVYLIDIQVAPEEDQEPEPEGDPFDPAQS